VTDSLAGPPERSFAPPLDQQPVDQQPVPPRHSVGGEAPRTQMQTQMPSLPQLPGAGPPPTGFDGPATVARPAGEPLIPPLETTSPIDFVDLDSSPRVGPVVQPLVGNVPESSEFEPLRSDPPPSLAPTWWLRSAILVVMLAAPTMVLWVEYNGSADDVRSSLPVIALHVGAGLLIMLWSFLAMWNAARVVPPSRYSQRSRGSIAVVLWVIAGAAPLGVVAANRRLSERLEDPDDLSAVFLMVAVVLVAFLLLWLPFRYHARQASKVGAPRQVMISWFFAPLIAAVGGLLAVSLGLGDMLAEDGLSPTERTIQVGVAYAMPMLVFALSTWRAIKVFDEVIDLRWRRWRAEWEQTLARLADEPPPGPEDSPSIERLLDR
jgi:heme/copper-type cytochrome/quinol oxidase subunit 2